MKQPAVDEHGGARHPLSPLFSPSSIAVVGASPLPDSVGGQALGGLVGTGYRGRVFPVNPKYSVIGDLPCYPSVTAIGEHVDCSVIVVRSDAAIRAVEESAKSGIPTAVVISSGFKEIGHEGAVRERRLAELARHYGIRILGPNCLGMSNFATKALMNFGPGVAEMGRQIAGGHGIAIVSQSGGIGTYLLHAHTRGVPFSYWVATGNSVDIDVGDCIGYLVGQPEVDAIFLYFETLERGSTLLDALDAAREAGVPVIALKAGRSRTGAAAVASHTGTAVGDARAAVAALQARGVLVVDSLDEGLEASAFLAKFRHEAPRARSVAVLTSSGGAGILTCDAADRHGVPLAALAPETVEALAPFLPDYTVVGNPVDLTGMAGMGDALGLALKALASDPDVGVIVLPFAIALHHSVAVTRPKFVSEQASHVEVPVAVAWMSQYFQGEGVEAFERNERAGLFRTLDTTFSTIAHWFRPEPPAARHRADVDWPALKESMRGRTGFLDELASAALLRAVGTPFVDTASTESASLDALEQLLRGWSRFPAVLKVVSPDLPHKAKAGGVRVALTSATEVMAAAESMLDDVRRSAPGATLDGFVVQEMAFGTMEVLVGAVRDPIFGPVVAIGGGGAGADENTPVTVSAAPLAPALALELVRATPTLRHLGEAAHVALADVMSNVGDLVAALPRIVEVDLNPVIVRANRGVVAVDALVRVDDGAD